MKWIFAVLLFVFATQSVLRADGPDEQYLRIYVLIQDGDAFEKNGDLKAAYSRYSEALDALKKLQTINPGWNEKAVNFRLKYLADKVEKDAPKAVAPKPSAVSTPGKAASEEDLRGLNQRISRLEAEKYTLENKLKEALTIQPPAANPELNKAREHVAALEKERDLLKVTIEQQKEKTAAQTSAADKKNLRLMEEQRDELARRIELLQKENTALKTVPAQTERLLADSQSRIQALEKERADLKEQIAKTATTPAPSPVPSDLNKGDLKKLKKLESERDELDKKLENALRELASRKSALEDSEKARSTDTSRVKKLEQEREKLEKKLADAVTQISDLKTSKKSSGAAKEMEQLRARLNIYESKSVPFTAEELALFRKPEARIASAPVPEPTAAANTTQFSATQPTGDKQPVVANAKEPAKKNGRKSVRDLPAGAGPLVADAQRAFAQGRFDEAEQKYLQVLAQDANNVYTLANLAAIQIELRRFDDAEKNIRKALETEPDDAFSLSVLGIIKFDQDKYDEAFDALSKSAQLNPEDAHTQNYLGITLSQKGQRAPAETALRKAIQLQPDYASAHHNLAVIYATQNPPFIELARWHYQKAVSLGHPKNPKLEETFSKK
jgi:tetratricopeptide (TPR) repeat protein